MPLLSVIVPVYNEENTIEALIARVRAVTFPIPREIIIVNDGSTDRTRAVLDGMGGTCDVRTIHADANGGKGSAVRRGLAAAKGDIVAIQDADLELDPAELAVLVASLLQREADVVYGSRFLAGRPAAPWQTILANRFLTWLTNRLFDARLTDMETCHKVMRTDIARSLGLRANRFEIEPEITARLLQAGHRIVELPVRFEPRSRAAGKKIGWHDGLEAVITLVRCRFGRS